MHFDSLKLVQTVENGNPISEAGLRSGDGDVRCSFLGNLTGRSTVHPGSRKAKSSRKALKDDH